MRRIAYPVPCVGPGVEVITATWWPRPASCVANVSSCDSIPPCRGANQSVAIAMFMSSRRERRTFVYAPATVHAAAKRLERLAHGLVVLENPRRFGSWRAVGNGASRRLVHEHGQDAAGSEFLPDAQRENPSRSNARFGPENLHQTERQQSAVRDALEHHIEIRRAKHEASRLAVHFGQKRELRHEQWLERARHVKELVARHRNESPVPLPRAVVDLPAALDFVPEVSRFQVAEHDVGFRRGASRQRVETGWQGVSGLAVRKPVAQEILRGRHSRVLQQGIVVRRIPGRQKYGMLVEPLGEHTAVMIRRRIHRSAHGPEATLAEPFTCRVQQRARDMSVVGTLEKAEEADPVAVKRIVSAILDRCDAANGPSVPPRDEQLTIRPAIERIALGVE